MKTPFCLTILLLGIIAYSEVCANSANIFEYLDQRNRRLHDSLINGNEHLNLLPRQYDSNGYEYLPVAQPVSSGYEEEDDMDEDGQFNRDWQAYLSNVNRIKEERERQQLSEKRDTVLEPESSRRDGEEQFENNLSGPHVLLGGNDRLFLDRLLQEQGDGDDSASNQLATENESTQLIKNAGKSDQDLPAYCNPPNPCPIGVDMRHLTAPCDIGIQNTKEFNRDWIWQKMMDGECDCDTKHMTKCPSTRQKQAQQQDSDEGSQFEDLSEEKRNNMHMTVVKKDGKRGGAGNPYLSGISKRSIVKKADPMNL